MSQASPAFAADIELILPPADYFHDAERDDAS
jgi:hypothetical protein